MNPGAAIWIINPRRISYGNKFICIYIYYTFRTSCALLFIYLYSFIMIYNVYLCARRNKDEYKLMSYNLRRRKNKRKNIQVFFHVYRKLKRKKFFFLLSSLKGEIYKWKRQIWNVIYSIYFCLRSYCFWDPLNCSLLYCKEKRKLKKIWVEHTTIDIDNIYSQCECLLSYNFSVQ